MSGKHLETLVEIGSVAASAHDRVGAAEEILTLLNQVIPYAAACISRYDPIAARHENIVNQGYPDRVISHLDNWFSEHDTAYQYMHSVDHFPKRWRDLPFPYQETYSAAEVFMPAGFSEGVTTLLFTRDGRYTGSLHVSTDDARHPADDAMPVLGKLQTMLAGLSDDLRTPAEICAGLPASAHAAVIGPDGRVVPIPGRSTGPHLVPAGHLVTTLVETMATGVIPAGFWWADADENLHRIKVSAIGSATVVAEMTAEPPYGVTARELDVLTLIVVGWSNPQIAQALFVSTKTVAKHVEHILAKLGCPTRTAAATAAVAQGLIRLPNSFMKAVSAPSLTAVA